MKHLYIKSIIINLVLVFTCSVILTFGGIMLQGGIASYNTPHPFDTGFGLLTMCFAIFLFIGINKKLFEIGKEKGMKTIDTIKMIISSIVIGVFAEYIIVQLFYYIY